MKLGFTGTSGPMRPVQLLAMQRYIQAKQPLEFHHGDCINADARAHLAAEALTVARIVIHPPINPKARAFCHKSSACPERVVVLPEKPYMERNQDIVDVVDELLACPSSSLEQRRSGTWATIRRARKAGKPVTIIWPDGTVTQ